MRICVFIGEGKNERYFFPSLLINKFGFRPFLNEKQTFLYAKNEIIWLFPFPPHNLSGGKDRLQKGKTYQISNLIIKKNLHLFSVGSTVSYRIIFDVDGRAKQSVDKFTRKIVKAIVDSQKKGAHFLMTDYKIFPVHKQLESWYFAGLSRDFDLFGENKKEIDRIMHKNPDELRNPKQCFTKLLNQNIADECIKIATELGRNFNVSQARTKSLSFHNFLKSLENDDLI